MNLKFLYFVSCILLQTQPNHNKQKPRQKKEIGDMCQCPCNKSQLMRYYTKSNLNIPVNIKVFEVVGYFAHKGAAKRTIHNSMVIRV